MSAAARVVRSVAVIACLTPAVDGTTLGGVFGRAQLHAQQKVDPVAALMSKALEDESAGRNREAIDGWRKVIAAGATVPGVLGLERVFSILALEDSLLPTFAEVIPRFPRDAQLRSAQLRTLTTVGRDAEAARAFAEWRDLQPDDVAPYRDYARVLLFHNRAAAADTVLRQATAALGNTRALVLEIAQMRAGLGLWQASAEAWREAMIDEPYYESATVFSLQPTPSAARDGVRTELKKPGAPLGAAQALSFLEIAWGSARLGWQVLAPLPPSDTVVAIWRQFVDEAERARSWAATRDALVAIHKARPDAATALRGAEASLKADDPTTALTLAREAGAMLDPTRRLTEVMPTELEALARLGRAREAEQVLAKSASQLGEEGVRGYARTLAWAWIRAGDVPKAREALVGAPLDTEDAVAGWLALFEGDLEGARKALRMTESPGQDVVSVLSLVNRTTQKSAPTAGAAFLALARGDSAQAARKFEEAAVQITDAASLLYTLAARIETARKAEDRAMTLWQKVATQFAEAPEAPEAQLEWARGLKRRGDSAGAREHLEHLILTYPGSALVPQARRELDALRMGTAE
ncbi:MAG: hypothetical protein ACKVS7_05240 [Gemmatimonadaceae bacterium]